MLFSAFTVQSGRRGEWSYSYQSWTWDRLAVTCTNEIPTTL